jgi:DNA repair protein RecO (recombination protein O)
VLGAFYWKLLELEGAGPVTDHCVRCGTTDDLDRFDVIEGGAVCGGCGTGAAVSAGGLGVIAMVLGGRLRDALGLEDSPAVREANNLAMNAMEAHLERGIRSLGVFDRHL